jgi:putative transposase
MKARSVFALFQLAHEDLSFCEARAQRSAHVPELNTTTTSASSGAEHAPAECYVSSTRLNTGLPELDYPFHDKTLTVSTCGRICFNRQKINLSTVFAGQKAGIKQASEEIWLVIFMTMISDTSSTRPAGWTPSRTLFGAKVLPMSPE